MVNDSPVRLKDIEELLGNVGLLARPATQIVSQGEADRFFERFCPKDRKER